MKVKNVDKMDHGIATADGYIVVPAGETIDADVPAGEIELVGKTGWFSFDGKPAGKPQPLFEEDDEWDRINL